MKKLGALIIALLFPALVFASSYGGGGGGGSDEKLTNVPTGYTLNSFILAITNTAGTIQHRCLPHSSSTLGNMLSQIPNCTATLTNSPTVNSVTAFANGGGIRDTTLQRFVLESGDIDETNMAAVGNIIFNSTGATTATNPIYAQWDAPNTNVNGTTLNYLTVNLRDDTGAAFEINTTNIESGETISIEFMGFLP